MSRFVLAALIFALVNVILFSLSPLYVGIFKQNAGHRRIIEGLVSVEKMPDILCLGTSTIRLPLWMCDFHNHKDTPSYNKFFKIKSFESHLLAKYNCNYTVATSALDGAMISDIYFFLRRALNSKRKPKLILLGVAPREFADSLYPDETQTVTFSCLFNASDLILDENLFCINVMQRLRTASKQMFFLHNHNDRFKSWLTCAFRKMANLVCLDKSSGKFNIDNPLMVNQPKMRSMREYRLRYGKVNFEQVEHQVAFFEKLADYCASLQIPIIVVNMPLTKANTDLLPEHFYYKYRDRLKGFCQAKNLSLVDLADEHFTEADFYDTAHLNDKGGQRLISKLSMAIASRSPLAAR